MTPEQEDLRAELLERYGEDICRQATALSGLRVCLLGLGLENLSPAQRATLHHQAGEYLEQLLRCAMPEAARAQVAECAKRMDAAATTWMLDEVEKQAGLSPD